MVIDSEVVRIEYRSSGTGSDIEGLKLGTIIENVGIPKKYL